MAMTSPRYPYTALQTRKSNSSCSVMASSVMTGVSSSATISGRAFVEAGL